MMYKTIMSVLVLIAAPFLIGQAHAVPVTDVNVDIDDQYEIGYTYFSVTTGGGFELTATRAAGSSVDPEIFLFRDPGTGNVTINNFLGSDDDGAGFPNSLLRRTLSVGNYIAAVGDYQLQLWEVLLGVNFYNNTRWDRPGTGDVIVALNGWGSHAGTGSFSAEVPEPAGIALLGIGLIAAGAGMRKRRKSS